MPAWLSNLSNWLRAAAAGATGRRQSLGQRGEALAARHLKRKGYIIVARSQRDRLGELDLVAVDRSKGKPRTLVFVEVKTRRSHDAGHPAEAVHDDKQRRITRLALSFLKRHQLHEHPARFDVVAVTWPDGPGAPQVEHIQGAFEATGLGDSMYA